LQQRDDEIERLMSIGFQSDPLPARTSAKPSGATLRCERVVNSSTPIGQSFGAG
jgi:hypothetical protein